MAELESMMEASLFDVLAVTPATSARRATGRSRGGVRSGASRAGRWLKQAGIEAVRAGPATASDPTWLEDTLIVLGGLCLTRFHLTVNDLWSLGWRQPPEPNLVGSVFKLAQSKGWMKPTDRSVEQDTRAEAHARRVTVWESNIVWE